jgi:hypothetical protein
MQGFDASTRLVGNITHLPPELSSMVELGLSVESMQMQNVSQVKPKAAATASQLGSRRRPLPARRALAHAQLFHMPLAACGATRSADQEARTTAEREPSGCPVKPAGHVAAVPLALYLLSASTGSGFSSNGVTLVGYGHTRGAGGDTGRRGTALLAHRMQRGHLHQAVTGVETVGNELSFPGRACPAL